MVKCKLLVNILNQFPAITQEEHELAGFSTGCALIMKGKPEKACEILIREGNLLLLTAQCMLTKLYVGFEHEFARYDPRIFSFFKEMALEGDTLNQFFYGAHLLYGIGVKQNIPEGLKYIEYAAQAGFNEASIALADYYDKQHDTVRVQKHFHLSTTETN